MRENDKIYGFNIALFELGNTIPSLFRTALDWRDSQPARNLPGKTGQLWDLFLKDPSRHASGLLRAQEEYSECERAFAESAGTAWLMFMDPSQVNA